MLGLFALIALTKILGPPFLYLENADEITAELLKANRLSKNGYFAELSNAMILPNLRMRLLHFL